MASVFLKSSGILLIDYVAECQTDKLAYLQDEDNRIKNSGLSWLYIYITINKKSWFIEDSALSPMSSQKCNALAVLI